MSRKIKKRNLHWPILLCSFQDSGGLPATVAFAGTSFVTTLPAPTIAFSPIVIPPSSVAPEPMEAPCLTSVLWQYQSASV